MLLQRGVVTRGRTVHSGEGAGVVDQVLPATTAERCWPGGA